MVEKVFIYQNDIDKATEKQKQFIQREVDNYNDKAYEDNCYLMFDINKLQNPNENDMVFVMKYDKDGVMQILDAYPLE